MNKVKKTGIVFLAFALLIGGLWFYWDRPLSLGDLIPEEEWVKMDLEMQIQTNLSGDIQFIEPPMEDILTQIQATWVTRAGENPALDDECFRITLYKGEAWPTVLYVGSTGRVEVAAEMQFDDWKYYEGGEELYIYLSNLSQRLPATYPVK